MSRTIIRKIGCLYLEPEHFTDEVNQTIGQPGLSSQIFQNRRNVTSRVNEKGQAIKEKVEKFFEQTYGWKVLLRWNRYCGCSMCPCSPGFDIKIELPEDVDSYALSLLRSRAVTLSNKFDIFAKDEELDIRFPKLDGWIKYFTNKEEEAII